MTRIRLAFASLVVAIVTLVGVGLFAQLPGYPVGIPQSVQSAVHGYLFGGTWSPSGAGSVLGIVTTLQSPGGNAANQDGLYVKPTIYFASSSLSTVTNAASVHILAPTLPTSGVATAMNLLLDAAPTGAASSFGAWLKGTIAFSSATPRLFMAPSATPSILTNTFGTSATIQANSPAAIRIDTGTASPTSGVIVMGATAQNGWACNVTPSLPNVYQRQTASAIDSVTISNYGYNSSSVLAWANNTILYISCFGY